MKLEIKIDPATYDAAASELSELPGDINKATKAAIKKTVNYGRTRIVRAFASAITAKQAKIKRHIRTFANAMDGSIVIDGKNLALISFTAKQLKQGGRGRGVEVEVFKGSRVVIPEAFSGQGPHGALHIMRRTSGKAKQTQAHYRPNIGKVRQKIESLKGPSLVDIADQKSVILASIKTDLDAKLQENLMSQVDRFLQRSKVR